MSDKELKEAFMKMMDDARTFREAVEAVKMGGAVYNDTWAIVSVVKAKEAGLL